MALDGRVAALRRRGVELPPPMVVADSWFSDSKLMRRVAAIHGGTLLVEGKSTYVFELADGRQVKGNEGCLVLFYTSRIICKGRITMEEIIFSLKH